MARNNSEIEMYPTALTIAGSDSGGGAGIEADLRTFNAFGVYGCAAITAVTAQNPREVRRIDAIPPEGVRAQIDAVCATISVRYAKSGMLGTARIILGHHTLGEVLTGFAVGLVCALMVLHPAANSLYLFFHYLLFAH